MLKWKGLFLLYSITRAEASLQKLAELNPYVTLNLSNATLTPGSDLSFLDAYQVTVFGSIPPD
jgi:hypothetical protein